MKVSIHGFETSAFTLFSFCTLLSLFSLFLSFWSTWQENWLPLDEDRGEGKRFSDLEAMGAWESNRLRPLRFRPLPLYEKRMRVKEQSETMELFLDQTFFFPDVC